jgi:hypothetical protein
MALKWQRTQFRQLIRSLDALAVHDLIGAQTLVLPKPRPLRRLRRGGLDRVGELSRLESGEQRLPGYRCQRRKPGKARAFLEPELGRSLGQGLADLHPLVDGQTVEHQQRNLGLAGTTPHRKKARHVVHHDRPLGDRQRRQVGIVLGHPLPQTLVGGGLQLCNGGFSPSARTVSKA